MSMDDSFYAAPESALNRPVTGQARPLEAAMAGEWDFDVFGVMGEAWELVSGSKGPIWMGMGIVFAVSIAVEFLSEGMEGANGSGLLSILVLILGIASNLLSIVITAGAYFFGLKRAAGDESAAFSDVMSGFQHFGPLLLISVLMVVLLLTGFLLLILPGIYLMVGYLLVWTLRMDRGLSGWEALETSRKALHHHWFKVFGLLLLGSVAVLVGGVLTLGVGFIWGYPFIFLMMGVLHYKAFGYAGGA